MRIILKAVFILLSVSYACFSQNTVPDPIDFSNYTLSSAMNGRLLFSDTSYKTGKLLNMWNNGTGAPTKMNEYYRMHGALSPVPHHELLSPSICFSDTSYLHMLHGFIDSLFSLAAPNSSNPAFGMAFHYDVCAPNRIRTVAGTSTSYAETYPDWSDSSGGAFGFLTRNSGYDSVFSDGNRRRIYTPSGTSAGTIILTHPYPNDEFIGDHNPSINATQNKFYGKELYLSFNLRRLDTASGNPNDTVLIIRMPYTLKPGMGPMNGYTRYTVFDSIPHDTAAPVQIVSEIAPYNRGLNTLLKNIISDSIIITRRMLPSDDSDITYSAHCNLKADNNPPTDGIISGNENHMLWSVSANPADTITTKDGRIKRIEPEVIYKGNCSLAIDWVRLATPAAYELFRGDLDSALKKSIEYTIARLDSGLGQYPSPNPWLGAYQGNIRWHRVWLLEEDHPRTYHTVGYMNHIFGGRGMSETHYTTHWPTREFDTNGIAIDVAPGLSPPYRATQTRYYTEHYARETNLPDCWRGDTYGVSTQNAVPYTWKWAADNAQSMGITRGYFYGATEQYNMGSITKSIMSNDIKYRYEQRWPASSLVNIEGIMHKYATDPYMLFDSKRNWISSVWAGPKISLVGYNQTTIRNCIPGVTCPRTAQFGAIGRINSGEELRFTQWLHRVLGIKGQSTWMYHVKPLGSYYNDQLGIPLPSNKDMDNDLLLGFFGMHTYTKVRTNPPDTATNLSWYRNESLGTDYFETTDPSLAHLFCQSRDTIAANIGVANDKIFFGRKTMRHEIKKYQDFCYYYDTLLVRLDLDYWYAKGYRTFDTPRNSAKDLFFHRKIDTTNILTKHIGYDTTKGIYTYSSSEPIDSTFFDITMLRDKTKSDTNEFYIGVLNRRLDPVFTIKMSDSLSFGSNFSDTTISTTKRFCSVPSVEFDSLIKLTSHPLVANKTIHKYCQNGARQISVPFKVRGIDDGDYPLLRIEELGGTLDTVIGSNRPLALNYLPGEGKIFRVRVQYPERFTGELPHSNQTKLVSHNIMVYDTVQNKWVEGDSAVYHAVYHKRITGNRTGVYYRVSKPAAMASNTNALQWHSEVLLTDSVYHHGRYNKADTCAYPSIVVRFDSLTMEYRGYIVYTCTSPYWGIPAPTFTGQIITENIVRLRKDSILAVLPAMLLDTVNTKDMHNYGTPMINASDTMNFYSYASKYRGIVAAWKRPDLNRILLSKTNIHYTDALNCYDVSYDTRHPSMNPYSRYIRGQKENDCALVWQEKGECIPYYNIFTTRLRVVNGNITYGLSPNYVIPLGYTVLFNFDSTIICLSAENQTFDTNYSHEFPVHYRELWDADDSSAVCDFQMYYPGHTPTDMRLDRIMWEVHDVVNGGGWFLGERGNWYRDTLIGGTFVPNEYGVGWRGNLWLSPEFPYTIYDYVLDQPSISAGMAAYYQTNPIANWIGCVNSYTQRAMNFNFRSRLSGISGTSILYSLPQTHMYPPVPEIVNLIEFGYVEQSHVAARGSVLLNDWWRNHRIYNKTANGVYPLTPYSPYQIRSSGQHYYRFGDNELKTLNVVSFGNQNGSYGIGAPTINNHDYTLYPIHSEPQRTGMLPFAAIDTLQTEWFTIDNNDILRYTFSGSNPQQTNVYMERKSDGARWLLPNMPLREYALSSLSIDLYNGDGEEYRIVTHGGENTYFIQNTVLAGEQIIYGKSSNQSHSINLREMPIHEEQLSLYPNPSSDKLTIGWSGGKANMQFINHEGNILSEQTITGNLTIDTHDIPNGLYVIRIQQGTHSITKSVIILK